MRANAAKHALARTLAPVLRTSAGVRVLTYHSIVAENLRDPAQMTTPVALFERHLDHLASAGYSVVPLQRAIEALESGLVAPRTVVLTFDDGFEDLYDLAAPVLHRYAFPATAFLTSGIVARELPAMTNAWPGRYLDAAQARELARSGLVKIGCHGATHVRLRGLRPTDLEHETAGARRSLEEVLDVPIRHFAYPFGSFDSFDQRASEAVRTAGMRAAMTGVAGINRPGADVFMLRRSRVSWSETPDAFERLLSGAYDWYAGIQLVQSALGLRLHKEAETK